jgi:hypothetical protein
MPWPAWPTSAGKGQCQTGCTRLHLSTYDQHQGIFVRRQLLQHVLTVLMYNCWCCRWPDLQAGVLMAPDCVMVLSERLQMFRDTEVSPGGTACRSRVSSRCSACTRWQPGIRAFFASSYAPGVVYSAEGSPVPHVLC